MALRRFNTSIMTKNDMMKLAPIEFFYTFNPKIEKGWFWTGSTLLLISKSLISFIFWFSLTTSSIFLSFSFNSCISISFWCLIYCSSSFFSRYSTFSCKISTYRLISWKPCFIYVICGYSSFYDDVTAFCFGYLLGFDCNIYEPMLMTIGEGEEPFLWPFFDLFRIDLYYSDY